MAELHLLDSCAAGSDGELHDHRRPRDWKAGALFLRELFGLSGPGSVQDTGICPEQIFFLVQSRVLIPMTVNISACIQRIDGGVVSGPHS